MLQKVKRTIRDFDLIQNGDRILVALSGGPDSVALLHLLCRLRSAMGLSLVALYINHQIRPREARKEEVFCRQLCDRLGVELLIEAARIPDIAKKEKKGIEEASRDFRYRTFESVALKEGCDKVALGHHTDDQVETILFRILRGTGKPGLVGIPVSRGGIIRPLYEVTRQEILTYLDSHHLDYCVDQSNLRSEFKRNYIRNHLLVDIRRHLNPAVDSALLNLSETASDEERYLDGVVRRALRRVARYTSGGKIELDLARFCSYDKWVRRRLLRHCLTESSPLMPVPDKAVVDRLDRFSFTSGRALSLPGRVNATRVGNGLVVHRTERLRYSAPLVLGRSCRIEPLNVSLYSRLADYSGGRLEKGRRPSRIIVDRRKLEEPLTVRSIRPGDRFNPLGMRGTKKVGDYLTDRKIDRVYRDEIPVVCDRQGIVWLVGFEIADRVKIDSTTKEVVRIELRKHRKARPEAV
jgi:tRNA(Ile)-lysidine synthase